MGVENESRDAISRPHDALVTAAVVLAAGSSSRMGEPKSLLRYRGKTFVRCVLDAIHDAAIDYAIVAVSPDDRKIIEDIDLTNVAVVYNTAEKAAGPIESIRVAVSHCINHRVDYLMVWPVDQPHITSNTISTLLNKTQARHPQIAVPVFQGKRGHPVLFSKELFPELLSSLADQGAHHVVRRDAGRVLEIQVEDRAVTEDIDTWEDYQELLEAN